MQSIQPFVDHLSQFLPLSEEKWNMVEQTIEVKNYPKKETLLRAGGISKAFYYILKGCVRMYYNREGEEKTTFFYVENQFVSSYESFMKQTPALHSLECIEPCDLIVISQESAMKLLDFSPDFERLARLMMEEEMATYQQIVASQITLTPEQRYLELIETRPDLIQRVPQYHLATYLGMNAESLSRIKKRISERS